MPVINLVGRAKRLYVAWLNMRERCNNPNGAKYSYYGGRGIRVCKRWGSYAAFAADMGPHPGNSLTLDRKNTNGNYCKSNCRWATRKTQSRNRRSTKLTPTTIVFIRQTYVRGKNCSFLGNGKELCQRFGISQPNLSHIIVGRNWQ
jgi:hypothetical protein